MDMDAAVLGAAGDRLSSLGDAALGHILSFLPAAEAARAAALSRRWRRVFPAVHTLSFREAERPFSTGYPWFKPHDDYDYGDRGKVCAPRFATRVSAALLGRDRAAAPLRALRVAFDEFGFQGGDARTAIDGWLSHAAGAGGGGATQLDLRLDNEPICKHPYKLLPQSPPADPAPPAAAAAELPAPPPVDPYPSPAEYVTPRSLFSSAVLRSLRLGGCRLDLPSAITLPSLETLHLTRVTGGGSGGAVQRLVSACPRLADLTLEACRGLAEVAVVGARLRRLALRCCHELTAVAADSSELRAFEYRGAVPAPWFLSMEHPHKLSFCALDFCGEEPAAAAAAPELDFLQLFAGVERLHLTSARLGRGVVGHGVFRSGLKFPAFPALRNLELTGMLPEDDAAAVAAVTRMLERTPSLETLSLFFLPEPHPEVSRADSYRNNNADEETIHASHKLRYDGQAPLAVPEGVEITCLREKTREINLVHYQGAMAQRMLAKFLLRNAPVVGEVFCEFARGPLPIQATLMEEIQGWVMNKSANMMFF